MAAVPAGFQYFIMWEPNGDKLEFKDSSGGAYCDASKSFSFSKGQGAPGRAWEAESVVFDADVQALEPPKFMRGEIAKAEGIRTVVCKFQGGCVYEYGSTEVHDAAPEI